MLDGRPEPPPQRRDNGLVADRYTALADVDPRLGDHLLDLLRLADIPAYLEPPGDPRTTARYPTPGPVERLYVHSTRRAQARELVVAAVEEAGGGHPDGASSLAPSSAGPDPLGAVDTDAEFARIIAEFDGPPARRDRGITRAHDATPPDPDIGSQTEAITAAMLDAAAEQRAAIEHDRLAGELDTPDEHYAPPPPPPFPVPAIGTIGCVVLVMFGLFLIARGDLIGFTPDTAFPLGVVSVLAGLGLLVTRLRSRGVEDDGEDDGAVL